MSVILYSINCPKCQALKDQLNKKGISFVENTNIPEMMDAGVKQIPTLSVDGVLLDYAGAFLWISQQEA